MVSGQTLPPAAKGYQNAQRREMAAALAAVERQWRRIPQGIFSTAWERTVEPQVLAVLLTAQGRISRPVGGYVSDVLADTGQGALDDPVSRVRAGALVGWTGDGRTVEGLVAQTPVAVQSALDAGTSRRQALEQGHRFLSLASMTLLADTARQAELLHMLVRPRITGYVRMLNPPSCSRCAVLAGRWYRRNQGFERHPGCDCRHIPASEAVAGDLRLNVNDYFDSLDPAEQERIFTKAGAKVIREGADPVQVVNARRGMTTSQGGRLKATRRYGRDIYVTTEGTTKHGIASRRRTGRAMSDRLMPESIVELADDPADLQRLLRLHGYIH